MRPLTCGRHPEAVVSCKRQSGAAPDGAGRDYTRKRLLWRLWHYEKLNGDVSVDAFPAVTYDSRKDGFRKVSFLWRVFRYERGAESRKLDILFLPPPVLRGGTARSPPGS